MGRGRRRIEPFEVEIDALSPKGDGVGTMSDGRPVRVKFAPPGGRVAVRPAGRKRGVQLGYRRALIRPPVGWIAPPCPHFGLCGGCILQELPLEQQRVVKAEMALGAIAKEMSLDKGELGERVRVHEVRHAEAGYRYRNRVELTFGPRQYLSEEALAAGEAVEGRFLGFHASGRFDRVVDVQDCALAHEDMNVVIGLAREVALTRSAPPPWDPKTHTGFWRHLLVRRADATGEVLVVLFTNKTTSVETERLVEGLLDDWMGASLSHGRVTSVAWAENAGVADVARGEVRSMRGRPWIEERLGEVSYQLSASSFFQTHTAGAAVLYDTVRDALGSGKGATLYDLYCGTGAIGLYLASEYGAIVGIEEVPAAVEDARANAERNGISSTTWRVGRVENELAVFSVDNAERRHLVVDPPRAGLHPRVARALSQVCAERLVYVACRPSSLGRDAAILETGGWRLTDLWVVDLFPQTSHVEVVGRFEPTRVTPFGGCVDD